MSDEEEMKHVVRIRRESDGRVAEYNTTVLKEYAPNQEDGYFSWEEGNFSCDCNRHSFFCEAIGEEENEDEDSSDFMCGHTRYRVLDITFENGDVYYPDGIRPHPNASSK